MGSEYQGVKYTCDICNKSQVILIEGNVPLGWSQVWMNAERPSTFTKYKHWVCEDCLPPMTQGPGLKEKVTSVFKWVWVRNTKETPDEQG